MQIINTYPELLSVFHSDGFDMDKWSAYMDAFVPGAKELCLKDMRESIGAGYSWDKDFLPVLNAVQRDAEKREEAISSFCSVTERLDERIIGRFGRTVDADILLYIGLCNGAGWVTPVRGKTTVLLGIEKIMELNWQGTDDMTALIFHELGHVYQDEFGTLCREGDSLPDRFLWQLFTEGVAMVFEQELIGEPSYFHQNRNGWKQWCDDHFELIRRSFRGDLETMTPENQRYFGDWVRFEGHGDTGYYLGARFVRFLLNFDSFDRVVCYGLEEVRDGFERFICAG